eukprot:TRINITY_DN11437_c0_g1_i2.p1 TRINITY_DN11437_c0_g1~~TRINITY_DN11437_c0_g1_i2.p1  ORF type:complete len:101 (-),score=23.18 TRINITY_DN11437_c0_g1_i2:7-309(-)
MCIRDRYCLVFAEFLCLVACSSTSIYNAIINETAFNLNPSCCRLEGLVHLRFNISISLKARFASPCLDQLVPVSYTHLRAHETRHDLVCRLLLEKKKIHI